MSRLAFAVPFLLACASWGQTAPATEPFFVLDTVGPAGWRQRLGPTNLGSLLASEGGRALWQPHGLQIDGIWQQLLGGDTAAFAASRQRVVDYGGAVHLRIFGVPGTGRDPALSAGIAFAPDGRTDLRSLADDLRRLLAAATGAEWQKVRIGDQDLEVLERGDDLLTAPWFEGDRLLLAIAPKDELTAARQRVRSLPVLPPPRPDSPALSMRLDVPLLRRLAGDPAPAATMRVLGLDALSAVELQLGAAGPHVLCEPRLLFGSGDRGVFGALFPVATAPSAFLALPLQHEAWKAGHVDLVALWETGERLAAALDQQEPAAVRKEAIGELGLDPIADLLAYTATDALLVGQFDRVFDSGPGGLFALRLKDEARFKAGLATITAKGKGILNKKETVDHHGIELWRYGDLFTGDTWVAVGAGMLVVGRGEDAVESIRGLLDLAGKTPLAPPDDELPAPWRDLKRHAPAGCNGAATTAVVPALRLLSLLQDGLRELLSPFGIPLELPDDPEALEPIVAMLREHHLDHMRTLTGNDGSTWRWRIFW